MNDAHDWAELLAREGYSVDILTEATRASVIEVLAEMVDRACFSDRIVFTYSGHGSWVPDSDGDESDGRDEVLVMADYMQGGLLSDDDLQTIFGEMRYGAGALILSDSCHSGTVSRFAGIPDGKLPRFLPPTAFTSLSRETAIAMEAKAASTPRRTASLISGCADPEFSYDAWFGTRANGAFSRAAIDTWERGMSQHQWWRMVREVLPNDTFPQTPQLTSANSYRKHTAAL